MVEVLVGVDDFRVEERVVFRAGVVFFAAGFRAVEAFAVVFFGAAFFADDFALVAGGFVEAAEVDFFAAAVDFVPAFFLEPDAGFLD